MVQGSSPFSRVQQSYNVLEGYGSAHHANLEDCPVPVVPPPPPRRPPLCPQPNPPALRLPLIACLQAGRTKEEIEGQGGRDLGRKVLCLDENLSVPLSLLLLRALSLHELLPASSGTKTCAHYPPTTTPLDMYAHLCIFRIPPTSARRLRISAERPRRIWILHAVLVLSDPLPPP